MRVVSAIVSRWGLEESRLTFVRLRVKLAPECNETNSWVRIRREVRMASAASSADTRSAFSFRGGMIRELEWGVVGLQ